MTDYSCFPSGFLSPLKDHPWERMILVLILLISHKEVRESFLFAFLNLTKDRLLLQLKITAYNIACSFLLSDFVAKCEERVIDNHSLFSVSIFSLLDAAVCSYLSSKWGRKPRKISHTPNPSHTHRRSPKAKRNDHKTITYVEESWSLQITNNFAKVKQI